MFDHVTIRASDRGATERFYDTVLEPLRISKSHADADGAMWDDLGMYTTDGAHPATRGLHVGFVAPSREHVDRFWQAGTEAGYRDTGLPGPRPAYGDDYYGGFLLDPDRSSPLVTPPAQTLVLR